MAEKKLPLPGTAFAEQVNEKAISPMMGMVSGEFKSSVHVAALGSPTIPGRVKDVWLSVGGSGKDDSNPLQVSGEVRINGTSVLSTVPSINHISGEADQQKTTQTTGDTGITQAVIDQDNNSFSPGDVLDYDLILDRTASPTTEITNPIIVVELEPQGIHRRS